MEFIAEWLGFGRSWRGRALERRALQKEKTEKFPWGPWLIPNPNVYGLPEDIW